MSGFFPEFGSDYAFPRQEAAVLEYWKQHKIFERVLNSKAEGKARERYGFYDGPPFATGLPHYGHLIAGTIKDIVPRYWTMRGYHVERRFGWDCHGLPVEFEIEKSHNLSGSLAIRAFGVAKFNEACRAIVLRHTSDWRKTVERMGRWVDLDNDYKTMNPDFMESVWWIFSELWKKGLVYQGKKVVPYSWRLTAPLSNFEASQNYKSVQDPAISVLLPLVDDPSTALVAWTTTPWTLPANLGLAVNKNFTYVKLPLLQPTSAGVKSAWVLESRAEAYGKELDCGNALARASGAELVGKKYLPLFPFYADRAKAGAFRVIAGDFVLDSDGTGIVHMAPAFGEDDFYACQREGIELVDPTDAEGTYTQEVKHPKYDLSGKHVKDPETDKAIIEFLKQDGRLLKRDVLQHNYPFCERSDTPLIYKAISSWFVAVEKIKENMVASNQEIHWVPGHIRDGRFGKWLENARDWCISRNRFWGTPIPVWICDKCGHKHVVGSREELNQLAGREIKDLHSHFVDEIQGDCPKCQAKRSLKRTPEVLDCWFESGAMPYAQLHYPFENKDAFDKSFPAEFIAEGLDQTRGWFYTLTVLSNALALHGDKPQPAFRNCIVNGMVLAEDGKKMSKRLKNYPDPGLILDKYGADALRLYFMQSPAVHGEELRFTERFLVENMRAVLLPLWNAYQFFASYANIDGFTPEYQKNPLPLESREFTDRWILALLSETEQKVHAEMEAYKLAGIAPILANFVDNLTNWYIRLNRGRFWDSKGNEFQQTKLTAYQTLFEVLDRLSKLLAPFLPFFAEYLHAALHHGIAASELPQKGQDSVHEKILRAGRPLTRQDHELVEEMRTAQKAILLGRSIRSEAKISLRQPLSQIDFKIKLPEEASRLNRQRSLIEQELNVQKINFDPQGNEKFFEETVKPDLKKLGPKFGKKLGAIQNALKRLDPHDIASFEEQGAISFGDITISLDEVFIERKAIPLPYGHAGALPGLVALLHTQLTDGLIKEGLFRECLRAVQQLRKDAKLHLTDRININLTPASSQISEALRKALNDPQLIDLLKKNTLAKNVSLEPIKNALHKVHGEWAMDEHGAIDIYIEKA